MSPLTYRTGEYQAASRFTTHATSDPLTAHYVRYAMHVAHDSPVEKTQILRRMQHLKFCSFSLTVAHDVKKSAKKKCKEKAPAADNRLPRGQNKAA